MRKGALRMSALVEDINRYHEKCANFAGSVVPGTTVEFEDFDSIINELDRALVAIRTLDKEVFQDSERLAYEQLRDSTPGGQVVLAFASLRDIATHRADVVDPDIGRAVGPIGDGRFIILPRWKQRAELPADAFTKQHRGTYNTRARAYDAHVAGRYVLDTLFDAFKFFDGCDQRLAPRADDGQIMGFPIPPLPAVMGYHRLGPDWPTHEEAEQNMVQRSTDAPPAGSERSIMGTIEGGSIVCGWTEVEHGRLASFTEPVRQVVADLGKGYPYVVEGDGASVTAADGRLVVAHGHALTDVVPDVTNSTEPPWVGWWQVVTAQRDLYVNQRKGL